MHVPGVTPVTTLPDREQDGALTHGQANWFTQSRCPRKPTVTVPLTETVAEGVPLTAQPVCNARPTVTTTCAETSLYRALPARVAVTVHEPTSRPVSRLPGHATEVCARRYCKLTAPPLEPPMASSVVVPLNAMVEGDAEAVNDVWSALLTLISTVAVVSK